MKPGRKLGPTRITLEVVVDDDGVSHGRVEQDGALIEDAVLRDWEFSVFAGSQYRLTLKPVERPIPLLADDYPSTP